MINNGYACENSSKLPYIVSLRILETIEKALKDGPSRRDCFIGNDECIILEIRIYIEKCLYK
jgi:hypothetical protein